MKTSESIKNLTKALVKAQAAMGAASKSADNPFFRSKYAGLPQVMEVVKGPLNDNGLIVLQPGFHREGKNFISTVIIHGDSGEFISSETEVVVPTNKISDPQSHGSAQTYARRFGLQAMLFIPAEDKDGEDLQDRTKPTTQGKLLPVPTPTTGVPLYKPQADPKALAQAASAPATTNEVARDEAPITTVAPLVKSSFRKPTKSTPPPVVTTEQSPQESGEWT